MKKLLPILLSLSLGPTPVYVEAGELENLTAENFNIYCRALGLAVENREAWTMNQLESYMREQGASDDIFEYLSALAQVNFEDRHGVIVETLKEVFHTQWECPVLKEIGEGYARKTELENPAE